MRFTSSTYPRAGACLWVLLLLIRHETDLSIVAALNPVKQNNHPVRLAACYPSLKRRGAKPKTIRFPNSPPVKGEYPVRGEGVSPMYPKGDGVVLTGKGVHI